MADIAVVKQVLENGPRNYIASYNFAQGSGTDTLSAYTAADPTSGGDMGVIIQGATYYPILNLKIWRVRYNLTAGLSVRVQWDASSDQDAMIAYGFGEQMYMKQGGLYVPNSPTDPITGATGKILFTGAPTAPPTNGTGYIELWLKKDIQQ